MGDAWLSDERRILYQQMCNACLSFVMQCHWFAVCCCGFWLSAKLTGGPRSEDKKNNNSSALVSNRGSAMPVFALRRFNAFRPLGQLRKLVGCTVFEGNRPGGHGAQLKLMRRRLSLTLRKLQARKTLQHKNSRGGLSSSVSVYRVLNTRLSQAILFKAMSTDFAGRRFPACSRLQGKELLPAHTTY